MILHSLMLKVSPRTRVVFQLWLHQKSGDFIYAHVAASGSPILTPDHHGRGPILRSQTGPGTGMPVSWTLAVAPVWMVFFIDQDGLFMATPTPTSKTNDVQLRSTIFWGSGPPFPADLRLPGVRAGIKQKNVELPLAGLSGSRV